MKKRGVKLLLVSHINNLINNGSVCMLGVIACFLLLSTYVFKFNYEKDLSELSPESQTVWIQIRPSKTSGLTKVRVRTVCKGYQQKAFEVTSSQ